MKDFAGRTAFVTGGANGIGIGLVRALLAQGCNVAIADIRGESIDAALKSLSDQRVMGVQVDVSSRESMARAADQVEAKFGTVSLLFNNAGINLFQTVEESSFDDWDWVMGVNLHGPINGVMTFVPRMLAAGKGGYIVNTASMAGKQGRVPYLAHYVASKFGVVGLTQAMAFELAPHGILVNCVCPGFVATPMQDRELEWEAAIRGITPEEVKRLWVADTPLGRIEEPEDVARVVAFLAGPDAGFMTGEAVAVNGGAFMD